MAKVTAPLLSFGGTGQVGKSIVFANWRGVDYARRYVIPANPRTTAQQANRTTFGTLREMWKLAPSLVRAPWDLYAKGQKFLGLNAFQGENMLAVAGQADMTDFVGSPGAKGGLPPTTFAAATGSSAGEIDLSFTNPTPPTDWTLISAIGAAFPDQDPSAVFGGPLVADEDDMTMNAVTLTGLGSGVDCVAVGWLEWQKPNGDTAYSVSLADTATTGA